MKKFLMFFSVLYLIFWGDYHLSNFMFERYCADKTLVGQFIYEREGLGEGFFRDIPEDKAELRGISGQYYLRNKKHLLNAEYFKEAYLVKYYEKKILSHIGPIYSYETSVIRKLDKKVLGKVVSLNNKLGWVERSALLWENVGKSCPKKSGHSALIRNIFYKDKI